MKMAYRRRRRRIRRKAKSRTYRRKYNPSKMARWFPLKHTNTNLVANGTGAIAFEVCMQDPSVTSDWGSISNLFDDFRVSAFKVQFISYVPNDPSGTTLYSPVFTSYDLNNTAGSGPGSIATAQEYDNCRVKTFQKNWSRYVRLPRFTMYSTSAGVSPQVIKPGYFKILAPPNTAYFYINATGLSANKVYGSLTYTFYGKAINRR